MFFQVITEILAQTCAHIHPEHYVTIQLMHKGRRTSFIPKIQKAMISEIYVHRHIQTTFPWNNFVVVVTKMTY